MLRWILVGLSIGWAQLSGVYFVNGISNSALRSYATLQEAFDELALQGAQDSVIFRVVHPYDPALEPLTIRVRRYTCTNCEVIVLVDTPVTIAKAPRAEWWIGQFVLRIQGGVQRFTLNGRGNLTLRCLTDTTAFTGVVGILPSTAGGISRVRIDSCTIEGLSRTKTWTALYVGDSLGDIMRPVPASVSDITISACTLRAARYGAAFMAWGWGPLSQVTITRSVLGYPTTTLAQADSTWDEAAIFGQFVSGLTIDSCLIEGNWTDGMRTPKGIYLDRCHSVTLRKNTIRNLRSLAADGYGVIGIHCVRNPAYGPAPHLIENNFIGGLVGAADESLPGSSSYVVAGVLLESMAPDAAATFTLRHNTIHLQGAAQSTAPWARDGFAASVVIGRNIRGGVELSSNLLQNTLALSSQALPDLKETCALAFWEKSSDIQWNSFTFRNNFYFVAGAAPERTYIARIGAGLDKRTIGSLTEWRVFSGLDGTSQWGFAGGAPFLSSDGAEIDSTLPWNGINAGASPTLTLQDIQGENRPQAGTNDPGTAPDIGADEVPGIPLLCPTPSTSPLSASVSGGLVGEKVSLSVNNPASLEGELALIWSTDGGQSWQTQAVLPSAFPIDFPLPAVSAFPATVEVRLLAVSPPGCPQASDTSAPLYLTISDRIGNRPTQPIPLTLNHTSTGLWTATHTDSLLGPGITDVLSSQTGYDFASLSPELFFTITVPDCIDSLDIDLCSEETDFDTRLHLIGTLDTITDRDQGYRADCTPRGVPAAFTSRIVAIGSTQRDIPNVENFSQPARPRLPLAGGTNFLIAVEGDSPTERGHFTLSVRAYKLPLAKPDLGPDRSVCLNPTGVRLSGYVPGANAYRWFLNGQLLPGATDSVVTLSLSLGSHTVVVEARREPEQVCAPLLTARDTVVLTIIPSINATIIHDTRTLDNGDTIRFTFGTYTLTAQAQASGAQFNWRLWNSQGILMDWTSGATYEREWGERGRFLLELESTTPNCTETDTLWVEVQPASEPASLSAAAALARIYPNPTDGWLHIEVPAADEMEIYDLRGHALGRYSLAGGVVNRLWLSLPAGSYMVRLVRSGHTMPLVVVW